MKLRIFSMALATLLLSTAIWSAQAIYAPTAVHAQDDFSCDNVSEIPLIECEALVAISTINPEADADIFDGWWTTNTPCSWARVVCEDGHITELVLIKPAYYGYTNLGLTTLPPEIRNFTRLTSLHLENHTFGGNLPSEIGDLSNLTSLYLGYNGLSSVPPEIGNLVALQNLKLMHNLLTSVPAEIGNLINLTSLSLGGNQLTSVPPELGNLAPAVLDQLANIGIRVEGVVFDCDNVSEIPQIECEALVAIRSTNPNAHTVFYPNDWLQTPTPCSWVKVTCEGGYITGLNLTNVDYPFSLGLTSVPPEIGNLVHLTSLHIDGSEVRALPPEIGNLVHLTSLHIIVSEVSALPPEIGNLVHLTSLHIIGSEVSALPPEIGNLADLTELHLGSNKLMSVPPEIFNLTNLTLLNLGSNEMTGLAPEIGNLVNLRSLDLTHNALTSVPAEIATLANLTLLELRGNEFTSVPAEFSNLGPEVLAQLADDVILIEGVNLDCAAVSQIPQAECEALVAIRNANPDASFSGGWAITEEPCSWEYVTCSDGHVSELRLYFDIITSLPPEIGNLTHLTVLDLDTHPEWWVCRVDYCEFPDHNKVTTLPLEIGNLTSLVTLDLGGNKLTNLPPEIGNLINLQVLDLRHNRLTTLPPAIGNLVNLTSLDLNIDTLTSLPPEIYNIPNIEDMNVDLSLVSGSLTATIPTESPFSYLPLVVR